MNTGMSTVRRRRLLALANLPKYRDGGPVRGPGTGTSDDVLDEVRPGSYIVPADTTEKVGPLTLRDVARNLMPEDEGGKRIPVRLSNGEYKLSPEQVHAIGVRTLDQIKNATHRPAAHQHVRDRLLRLADGGEVSNVVREGNSYSGGNVSGNITINGQAPGGTYSSPGASAASTIAAASQPAMGVATGGAATTTTTGTTGGLYGVADRLQQIPVDGYTKAPAADGSQNSWANTEVGRNITNAASALPGVAGALPAIARTGGAISNGVNAASRLLNIGAGAGGMSAVPSISFASTADSPSPAAAPAAASPAASAAVPSTLPSIDSAAPAQPASGADAGAIRRIDRPGQSPLYTNLQDSSSDLQSFMARPAGGPSAQNMAAADNLAASSQSESMGRVQAQMAREEEARRNGPDALRARALDTLASRQIGSRRAAEAMFNAAGNMDRERSTRDANALEAQRYAASDRLARDEFGLKQAMAGFQNRSAQRVENAQVAYEQAATPALRAAARDRLLALAGKAHEDQWKAVALQGGTDAMGNKTESILGAVNERTGEMRRMPTGQAGADRVTTKAQFDALPKGATYTGEDGRTYRKP